MRYATTAIVGRAIGESAMELLVNGVVTRVLEVLQQGMNSLDNKHPTIDAGRTDDHVAVAGSFCLRSRRRRRCRGDLDV